MLIGGGALDGSDQAERQDYADADQYSWSIGQLMEPVEDWLQENPATRAIIDEQAPEYADPTKPSSGWQTKVLIGGLVVLLVVGGSLWVLGTAASIWVAFKPGFR